MQTPLSPLLPSPAPATTQQILNVKFTYNVMSKGKRKYNIVSSLSLTPPTKWKRSRFEIVAHTKKDKLHPFPPLWVESRVSCPDPTHSS